MLNETMVEHRLNVLSVSTMFPSSGLPQFGVFVRYRLQHVASRCNLRVVSGVPTFPIVTRLLGRYRRRLDIARSEVHGEGPTRIDARYPHFLSVPKFLKPLDGFLLAAAVYRECLRLRVEGFAPDLIDAHLAFPDGFASVLVGALIDTPVAITVRGHDVNDMRHHPVRWSMTKFALSRADLVLSVSKTLLDEAIKAGARPPMARAVTNGVDPSVFHPLDQRECRRRLGLPIDRKIVVSVGHMIERKGFHVLIEALSLIPVEERPLLVIVGGRGEEFDFRPRLDEQVNRLSLHDDVLFTGTRLNTEICPYYNAADVSALASSREGWPNVLFESLACGRPVVATDVHGNSECLSRPEYGILVPERSGSAFAHSLTEALWHRTWDSAQLVDYAAQNTWNRVGEFHMSELSRMFVKRCSSKRGPLDRALFRTRDPRQ